MRAVVRMRNRMHQSAIVLVRCVPGSFSFRRHIGEDPGDEVAISIYLACGERGNEGIIHRPKDESEFLGRKKTFEANIFKFFIKGEPISKFWGTANQNTYRTFVVRFCDIYTSWKFFTCPTPQTPWKFLPFNPPTP